MEELLKQILAAQIAQVALLQSIQAHVASHSWDRLSPDDLLEMNPSSSRALSAMWDVRTMIPSS